jgi:ribosomal protein S18 acetylase RimI-like enzyme
VRPILKIEYGEAIVLIQYQQEPTLSPEEFIGVLVRSTLAERRPVHDGDTIQQMLAGADVIATARVDGLLVGVSRALTDFAFCTYLSDLAVDVAYQRRGIGRELIRRTHEAAGLQTMLLLIAAPKAQTYYPSIGMTKHESCWFLPRREPEETKNEGDNGG